MYGSFHESGNKACAIRRSRIASCSLWRSCRAFVGLERLAGSHLSLTVTSSSTRGGRTRRCVRATFCDPRCHFLSIHREIQIVYPAPAEAPRVRRGCKAAINNFPCSNLQHCGNERSGGLMTRRSRHASRSRKEKRRCAKRSEMRAT